MKYLLILTIAVLALALVATAANVKQGPIPTGGWGKSCAETVVYSLPWAPGEAIYDPLGGGGGAGWRLCPGCSSPITWPELDVELWIEMECIFTFEFTSVDIHLASDYNDRCVQFYGTSSCNNGQVIIVNPPTGGNLNVLPFVQDMFNRTGPTYGTDIPVAWNYSLDGAGYLPMVPGTGGAWQFPVGKCDHYYQLQACLDIAYHQEDGYYTWATGGFLCPAEPL